MVRYALLDATVAPKEPNRRGSSPTRGTRRGDEKYSGKEPGTVEELMAYAGRLQQQTAAADKAIVDSASELEEWRGVAQELSDANETLRNEATALHGDLDKQRKALKKEETEKPALEQDIAGLREELSRLVEETNTRRRKLQAMQTEDRAAAKVLMNAEVTRVAAKTRSVESSLAAVQAANDERFRAIQRQRQADASGATPLSSSSRAAAARRGGHNASTASSGGRRTPGRTTPTTTPKRRVSSIAATNEAPLVVAFGSVRDRDVWPPVQRSVSARSTPPPAAPAAATSVPASPNVSMVATARDDASGLPAAVPGRQAVAPLGTGSYAALHDARRYQDPAQ